jgi:transposase
MSAKRYPEKFKLAAVRQITEGGYTLSDVASRLDVTADSLYALTYSPFSIPIKS